MISVVIPFTSDTALLGECLAHLEQQTFRNFNVILVPDAVSTRGGSGVHVIPSGAVLPNRKRQIAALATTAPIVAFIDDDAYPAPGWLEKAVRHFEDPSVVACGGPGVTPASDSHLQRAGGAVFAAPIVTATTRHRYIPEHQRDVDALPSCNLLMRREAFLRAAEATIDYWPGEDILVCIAATQDGSRIVYDPEALVYHHRRALFGAHLRQVWRYGFFRGYFLHHVDHSLRTVTYYAPSAFALAHTVVLPMLARRHTRGVGLLAIGSYAAAVTISAVAESRGAKTNPLLVAAGIYLTHLTYGAGTIAGWLRRRVSP